jgi:ferredoxin, 2Fe-2S
MSVSEANVACVTFKANRLLQQEMTVEAQVGESLQAVAQRHHVPMGDACGGNAACSTCHCYVLVGRDDLSGLGELEDAALDKATAVRMESRLGCQARVTSRNGEYVVSISDEGLAAFEREHPAGAVDKAR